MDAPPPTYGTAMASAPPAPWSQGDYPDPQAQYPPVPAPGAPHDQPPPYNQTGGPGWQPAQQQPPPLVPPRPQQHEVDLQFNPDEQAVAMLTYHQMSAPSMDAQGPEVPASESDDTPITLFTEKSIRLGFVKKVFAILLCQLVFTAAVVCFLLFVDPIKQYLIVNDWVYITSLVLSIVLMFIFGFVTKLRRRWPWNLVFLLIITFSWSVTLGAIASTMEADEVLMAVGVVCAVAAVCCLLGFQRKFDFTPMVGFVSMLGMVLVGFAFLSIFFYSRITSIVFACLGAFIYSMWLLLDIQLILGGRHKLGLNPEEYVSGALNIYVDIVYILLMMFFIFRAT